MAMAANEIEKLIKAAFPDAIITIEDLRGDGDHYACNVPQPRLLVRTAFSNTKWCIKHSGDAWVANCTPLPCKHRHRKNRYQLQKGKLLSLRRKLC